MSEAKLGYWRRRLAGMRSRTRPSSAAVARVEFRPVQVVGGAEPGMAVVEIALAAGERVIVHSGATTEMVTAVIGALRSRC